MWKKIAIFPALSLVLFGTVQEMSSLGTHCLSESSPDGRYTIEERALVIFGTCYHGPGFLRLRSSNGKLLRELYVDYLGDDPNIPRWEWDATYDSVKVHYYLDGMASTFWLLDRPESASKPPAYDQHRLNLLIENNDVRAVRSYLKSGMDLNMRDEQGRLPLVHAAYLANPAIVKSLLSHGADINAKDHHGSTALHWSKSSNTQDSEITQILVEHGADVNARDNYGATPLFTGIRTLSEIKYLVSKGADVRIVNNQGQSVVSGLSDLETIRYVLDQGASVDFKSPWVPLFLYHALIDGKIDLVRFFEDRGADIAAAIKIRGGIYPLHYAAENGDLSTIAYLIEHGADVNEVNEDGHTALQITNRWIGMSTSYQPRLLEVVEYLRNHGAK